jgi:NADH:ubiquinone oxidoreductase subunit E
MSAATPDPVNPASERIAGLIQRQGGRSDGLIEVLHQVQEIHGYLPRPALLQVARALQLPLSRVYGVASFYHLFRLQPPAGHRCAVCLGTACFVRGGGRLAAALKRRLGLGLDQSSDDGLWALEQVSCLGACGQAPVLVLDGALFTAPLSGPLSGSLSGPSAAPVAAFATTTAITTAITTATTAAAIAATTATAAADKTRDEDEGLERWFSQRGLPDRRGMG